MKFCIVQLLFLNRFNAFHSPHFQLFPLGNPSFISLLMFFFLSFHLSILSFCGKFLIGWVVVKKFFLDLCRNIGGFFPWNGWRGSLSSLCLSISDAIFLWISGEAIPESTYISSIGVGLRQPEIVLQVSFKAMFTFLEWSWPIRGQHIQLLNSI